MFFQKYIWIEFEHWYLSYQIVLLISEFSSTILEGKIISGFKVPSQILKYVVSLEYQFCHFATGSLVSPTQILTTASSVYEVKKNNEGKEEIEDLNYEGYVVMVGTHNLSEPGHYKNFKDIIIHPDYVHGMPGAPHDIAFVEVSFKSFLPKIKFL